MERQLWRKETILVKISDRIFTDRELL